MYRIFIVEDDEIIAGTVKSYLEKWNYTVLCVENSNNVLYFYSANHAPYTYIDVIFWRLLCSFIGIVISVITRKSRKIHPALWISGIISCMLGFIVCMFVFSMLMNHRSEESQVHSKIECLSKNERAIQFYLREEFSIQSESLDSNTGEKELIMVWKR